MSEVGARQVIADAYGADAIERLELLARLVGAESERQNLIAPSTLAQIWQRHILDSAQLLTLAPRANGGWIDVGSGAGFPGLVIAVLRRSDEPVVLIEPRRRRAEFLEATRVALGLANTQILACRAERAQLMPAGVISARAVASLDAIFTWTAHLRSSSTVYLLPKGQSAVAELEAARLRWQGLFHVEQSVTQSSSSIVIARGVAPKCIGSR